MEFPRMMNFNNRVSRHLIFWLVWVIGFTFIKSFGESTYKAWFSYYIITLPVFMVHTYLLVYWVFKKFGRGLKLILAILLFILFLYVFSFIELFLTEALLANWFPDVFSNQQSYLHASSVIVGGIGNLYIVLVFIASKMIREWYLDEEKQKSLSEQRLHSERKAVSASIQPGMLLYAVEQIEALAKKKSDLSTLSVSALSEVLNNVMQHSSYEFVPVEDELRLAKKLQRLYMLFDNREVTLTYRKSDGCDSDLLPTFMLFTPLEMFRRFDERKSIQLINILQLSKNEVEFYLNMLNPNQESLFIEEFKKGMSELYPGRFQIEETSADGSKGIRIAVA